MDSRERPILLVDDDASDIELTRWAFQNSGFTTDMAIARDGLEALDLLLPSDGRPPLEPAMVLMDVDMPRMGGVETVRRIRAEPSTRMLPVIMLTCSLAERDIVDSSNVGANGYVQKPLDIEDLLKVASAVGAFWIEINRTHGTPGRPGTSPPMPSGLTSADTADTAGLPGSAGTAGLLTHASSATGGSPGQSDVTGQPQA